MRHLPRTIITTAGIVLLLTLCGCCNACKHSCPAPSAHPHAAWPKPPQPLVGVAAADQCTDALHPPAVSP